MASSSSILELDYANEETVVLGFDEAGRGPLAGPVTVSLVSFNTKKLQQIHNQEILIGLNDSKKLTSRKREQLYDEIIKHSNLNIVQSVSSKFVDRWNINQAIFYAIHKSLRKLKIPKPFLILDGNYKLESSLFLKEIPQYISIPKADTFVYSVSAASILAKVTRDRLMEKYSNKISEYGWEKNSGYGTAKHIQAIQKFGISYIHRKSYCKNFLVQ
jgi:ribonuclease HII